MRYLFIAVAAALLSMMSFASAQQTAPANPQSIETPAGYDQFFADVEATMKKYPDAAKRFTLRDLGSKPVKGKALYCSAGQHACCMVYADPCCSSGCQSTGCCDILK
jgi:hypothetical protein